MDEAGSQHAVHSFCPAVFVLLTIRTPGHVSACTLLRMVVVHNLILYLYHVNSRNDAQCPTRETGGNVQDNICYGQTQNNWSNFTENYGFIAGALMCFGGQAVGGV